MMVFPSALVFLVTFFTVGSAFREAKDEEFPFQVSIQNINKRHICGGAIITPKWVLTSSACLKNVNSVRVCYGSADSNNPLHCINSNIIRHQSELNLLKKDRLALVKLENSIEFSKTAKQARLPTAKVILRNTTKLSGWKTEYDVDVPPNLYVSDRYHVILENCKTDAGTPIRLGVDEFCGQDEEGRNFLRSGGAAVSKSDIVLGILTDLPMSPSQPFIYVKLSEHDQWIKDILDTDAYHIHWANEVPKDSALSNYAISLALIGISSIFTRFL